MLAEYWVVCVVLCIYSLVRDNLFYFRISEYIPPRPPLPRRVGGAERAVHDFHEQTAKITNILLEEYR